MIPVSQQKFSRAGRNVHSDRSGISRWTSLDYFSSCSCGFTLIELVTVVIILGVTAAVAIPVIGTMIQSSKETATKQELQRLAVALAGTDASNEGGFEGDVGFLPDALPDLTRKPDSVSVWNAFTHVGWNGPYVDSTNGDYLVDAWGVAYTYTPGSRTLQSTGSGSPITITF